MTGPSVFLCHRSRLLTECLLSRLREGGFGDCRAVTPEAIRVFALSSSAGESAEILLLDAGLGVETCGSLASRWKSPSRRTILLTSRESLPNVVGILASDCNGCVCEEMTVDEVRAALRTVVDGRPYCSPYLGHSMFIHLLHEASPAERGTSVFTGLTGREREILQLIAHERLGNKQIALRLHVSLYTVKNHVHRIIEKLGVQDRHQAADVARQRPALWTDNAATLTTRIGVAS